MHTAGQQTSTGAPAHHHLKHQYSQAIQQYSPAVAIQICDILISEEGIAHAIMHAEESYCCLKSDTP
jgi:hypothetical protein